MKLCTAIVGDELIFVWFREIIYMISSDWFRMEQELVLRIVKNNASCCVAEQEEFEPAIVVLLHPVKIGLDQYLRISRIKLWYSGKEGRLLCPPPSMVIRVIFLGLMACNFLLCLIGINQSRVP